MKEIEERREYLEEMKRLKQATPALIAEVNRDISLVSGRSEMGVAVCFRSVGRPMSSHASSAYCRVRVNPILLFSSAPKRIRRLEELDARAKNKPPSK